MTTTDAYNRNTEKNNLNAKIMNITEKTNSEQQSI